MFQPWIHCCSLNGIRWTVVVILPCLSLDVLQTLNSQCKNGGEREKESNWSDFCQALFFTWHISYFFGGGEVADRLSISWRAHKSKETWQKASPRAPLPVSPARSWPSAPRVPTWEIPQTNGSIFHSRVKVFGIVLRDLPAPLSTALPTGRKWAQGTESARGGGRGSDLNRCRTRAQLSLAVVIIPPAAPWQMALWDIGFYGRSSFISNFFSHLMRSSRSSQIQFAVWILIGLFHLLTLYHLLSFPSQASAQSLQTYWPLVLAGRSRTPALVSLMYSVAAVTNHE